MVSFFINLDNTMATNNNNNKVGPTQHASLITQMSVTQPHYLVTPIVPFSFNYPFLEKI